MTTPAVPDLKIAQTVQAFCAEPFPESTQAKLRVVIEANGKVYEHVLDAAAVKLQPGVKKLMVRTSIFLLVSLALVLSSLNAKSNCD